MSRRDQDLICVRYESFTATKVDKIISDSQPYEARHFMDLLCTNRQSMALIITVNVLTSLMAQKAFISLIFNLRAKDVVWKLRVLEIAV
jgi:phage terminase large subunit-like protein